jgi:hypothetical protein
VLGTSIAELPLGGTAQVQAILRERRVV